MTPTYQQLEVRCEVAQVTIRNLLCILSGVEAQLLKSKAIAEIVIAPEVRDGSFKEFLADFDFYLKTINKVTPNTEKIAEEIWQTPKKPLLMLVT